MKYKVKFYKSSKELITERKANFVNNLKKISSKITDEIANKIGGSGSSGDRIVNYMMNMISSNKNKSVLKISIPELTNRKLGLTTLVNDEIPISFTFKNISNELDSKAYFSGEGNCYFGIIVGQLGVNEIEINLEFSLDEENASKKIVRANILDEIQSIIVHELAHAHDKMGHTELHSYEKTAQSKNERLQYLYYWLKPTEIRSHVNEMINFLSSKKYQTPKRIIKNMYKTADKAAELDGEKISDETKKLRRQAYSSMNKNFNNMETYQISKNALQLVISRNFDTSIPKSISNFILNYHIAFIRDSSPLMKERYYDKYFPNCDVAPLEQYKKVFEEIQTIYRSLTRLQNDIKKRYSYNLRYGDKSEYDDALYDYDEFEDLVFDLEPLSTALNNLDTKMIKKASKKLIEEYREEKGFITKSMLSKSAKEWAKEQERQSR